MILLGSGGDAAMGVVVVCLCNRVILYLRVSIMCVCVCVCDDVVDNYVVVMILFLKKVMFARLQKSGIICEEWDTNRKEAADEDYYVRFSSKIRKILFSSNCNATTRKCGVKFWSRKKSCVLVCNGPKMQLRSILVGLLLLEN